jgi:hypothetical protein
MIFANGHPDMVGYLGFDFSGVPYYKLHATTQTARTHEFDHGVRVLDFP